MESCPSVKNILLLDSEGNRVAVKYCTDDWPTLSSKLAFEKAIFTKTQKTNARSEAEITLLESNVVVYKFVSDLHFFVTGGDDENELILLGVLQGFFDAVGILLSNNVDKITALEHLDVILLCLDEIVDGGIVLETDANVIASKVATDGIDGAAPFSEQTLSQAFATAREHLARSLLKVLPLHGMITFVEDGAQHMVVVHSLTGHKVGRWKGVGLTESGWQAAKIKIVIATGLAADCMVQGSYAMGVPEPLVSVFVDKGEL